MEIKGRKVLLCDCEHSMSLDPQALAKACGASWGEGEQLNTQLCRAQIDNLRAAGLSDQDLLVACTQEAPLFQETLEALVDEAAATADSQARARFVNIRERAGWSKQAAEAGPKIAALLAEATVAVTPAPSITLESQGVCLVYGRDEVALDAARQLASRLDVTLLLSRPEAIVPPRVMDVPIFKGTVTAAKGFLGAFEVLVDDYAPLIVSSRSSLAFEAARNGAASKCDLILDLSGEAPLFPAHEKRDGYCRPDPGNPAAIQRALFDLADMVGEFEKPLYVNFDRELCAHSRSTVTGCTRCLDVCPAAAIQPNGDSVAIDPYLCGGCGACNAVCPTGAASYAMPANATLLERAETLLSTYFAAGGQAPVLLLYDEDFGEDALAMMARFGDGLPARVLPFALREVTQVGFEFLVGALAKGATSIAILVPPKRREELAGLAAQIGQVEAVMAGLGYGGGRVTTILEDDPDATAAVLYGLATLEGPAAGVYQPLGGRRSRLRQALEHLHNVAPQPSDLVFLPPGAPFGGVEVKVEGCTLCLACVSACPTGALQDNPELPQLRFQEEACIQCGLCQSTCPETVISLAPRLNFSPDAREAQVIKEEEPFHCVRCGQPFGTKSSIERIVDQLAEKHSMFQEGGAIERIKMCADCRVTSQFDITDNPLAGDARPAIRTTDDYLRERAEIEAARAEVKAEQSAASKANGHDQGETKGD